MDGIAVMGIRCGKTPEEIGRCFASEGMETVIFDPDYVCGKDHLVSAYLHAERAFSKKTNRSKNILSETILYAAADRQVGKAIAKMSPKEGQNSFVILVINGFKGKIPEKLNAIRDDSLIECDEVSARNMGLEECGIPYTELVLEHVASVDVMKN
ncbi:MAG: KEOPS complex subunit Cgi121 [Candidatus Methanomethylophilaceae archaeon]|jgi:KEOPS complex subunit Cgi121